MYKGTLSLSANFLRPSRRSRSRIHLSEPSVLVISLFSDGLHCASLRQSSEFRDYGTGCVDGADFRR